jgi:hypothetical protein
MAERFEGGCHCGNLFYVFSATAPLTELGLRACMCRFCRAHGARNASDPNGAMQIDIRSPDRLVRYRFGLRTADFLLCSHCGVYIGALLPDDGAGWFTVNVNTFHEPPALDVPIQPVVYDSEDTGGRVDRRKMKWTPISSFRV